jgi:hypothetical protein
MIASQQLDHFLAAGVQDFRDFIDPDSGQRCLVPDTGSS